MSEEIKEEEKEVITPVADEPEATPAEAPETPVDEEEVAA